MPDPQSGNQPLPRRPGARPPASIFWRFLAFLALWDGVLWLVVGSVLGGVLPGGWIGIAALWAGLLGPGVVLARNFASGGYPSAAIRIWLFRPFWYGQLFLPFVAAAGMVGLIVGAPFGSSVTVGRGFAVLAGVALLSMAVAGYAGSRRLVVRRLDLLFADLPEGLAGMRIVQLSDLHVGPQTSARHLSRVRDAVGEAAPDLIVLTGDQVDDYARDVEPLGRALGSLSAPLGIFAVPGNHDVYAGWAAVRRGMEALGWRVLVNDAVALTRNRSSFWLAGTGDPAARGFGPGVRAAAPDIHRTLARVTPGEFTIVLAHNPALWPELAARGADVTLSGHTHYGQFVIPHLEWSLASAFLEHSMGVYRQSRSVLYISPGTNYWGIPLRIGTPPEVTVVTLHRGGDDVLVGSAASAASAGYGRH